MSGNAFPPIGELLPHRPPMQWLDEVVRHEPDVLECRATFRAGDGWTAGGLVPRAMLVECMAQTAAALNGLEAIQSGGSPPLGMLVAIRNLSFAGDARVDEPIDLRVQIRRRMTPFALAHGWVGQAGVTVAEGELRFYVDSTASTSAAR